MNDAKRHYILTTGLYHEKVGEAIAISTFFDGKTVGPAVVIAGDEAIKVRSIVKKHMQYAEEKDADSKKSKPSVDIDKG